MRLTGVEMGCWPQIELHPFLAQRKLLGVCLRKGVLCTGYCPLGSQRSKELIIHPVVNEIAKEVGKTPAQVSGAKGGAWIAVAPFASLCASEHIYMTLNSAPAMHIQGLLDI